VRVDGPHSGTRIGVTALLLLVASVEVSPQAHATRSFRVRETMGIRRTEYPVNARFTFVKGALSDPAQTRLAVNGVDVAAQVTAATRWDDRSVQVLDVDFNASLDPEEERRYELQFGEGVAATTNPVRGLTVEDLPAAFQVGNVRFSKSGTPLMASVTYRGEGIGAGPNGVTLTDATGQRHDLTNAIAPDMTIVKPGPLYVVLRYTATVPLDPAYSVPVEVMIEMPNSKSWVKMAATVRDPARRLRDIAIDTPFAFGEAPWLWDFGTDSGTYGVFRNPTDGVVLTQTTNPAGATGWKVDTIAQGQRRPYEASASTRAKMASGWGHLQDGKAAVAFAVERFGRDPGVYSIALDGRGQASFRFAPSEPATQHRLVVYQHFVATPVAIGAATNPTAMLSPIAVTIER
jgi:hypothetical protein